MTKPPSISYAQNGEDVVLARALQPDEHAGFWIDVGAGDPWVCSVTAAFAERGWRGINIEPHPGDYRRLCDARPDDVNLRVALGAEPGDGCLFAAPPEKHGLSTLVPELAARYGTEGQVFEPIEVRITTLSHVVAEHAPDVVDFLKIDVEGSERAVLAGADWSTFHPRIIVIEATVPDSSRMSDSEREPILLAHGYKVALFDGLNRFYVSESEPELFEQLQTPANIHDQFVPQIWADELSAVAEAAHAAESKARHFHDRLAIALDEVATLRNDLDSAQRLNALALGDLERAQREAAEARDEIAAIQRTRLHRLMSPARKTYGAMRRGRGRPPADETE